MMSCHLEAGGDNGPVFGDEGNEDSVALLRLNVRYHFVS
jgi:hypothetical protein